MQREVIELRMPHEEVKSAAKLIADEIADKIYYEFLLLRYLPEIELVSSGRIKTMRNDEISDFIKKRIASL